MNKSLKLGTYFGIPVFVHWSFSLLLLYMAYDQWREGMDIAQILWFLLFILTIFLCVTLHEYGHALAARRFGINTQDIILSPIGGVARLEKIPKDWYQEFIIAIAGPAVNFAIVLIGILAYFAWNMEISSLVPKFDDPDMTISFKSDFLFLLLSSNGILALFNLVPAFPMDGGRVFRALLSIKLDRVLATTIAARLGQLIAVAFLFWVTQELQIISMLVAMFIFMAAGQELNYVKYEAYTKNNKANMIGMPTTKVDSIDELYLHPNRQGKSYWLWEDEGRVRIKISDKGEVDEMDFIEISGEISLESMINLKKSQPAKILIYSETEGMSKSYYVIDNAQVNEIPKIYQDSRKRKSWFGKGK